MADLQSLENRVAALERVSEDPSRNEYGAVMRKVHALFRDFEAQVAHQLSTVRQGIEKTQPPPDQAASGERKEDEGEKPISNEALDALKCQVTEVNDMLTSTRNDANHVKRIVLACERDMEDFTAAMDAVNVDLDEMRARVDTTHSIITSRQRVEAAVTAEISTMRLDMGDMQEALKTHDTWMEDVSVAMQEAHERIEKAQQEVEELRAQQLRKLESKVDNEDLDTALQTIRDSVSTLRFQVDTDHTKMGNRISELTEQAKVIDHTASTRIDDIDSSLRTAKEKFESQLNSLTRLSDENLAWQAQSSEILDEARESTTKLQTLETRIEEVDQEGQSRIQHKFKEITNAADLHASKIGAQNKEVSKKLDALDLRTSALQGAIGEAKRDLRKLQDDTQECKAKEAAFDTRITKLCEATKSLTKQHNEEEVKYREKFDEILNELDTKGNEEVLRDVEGHLGELSRGVVKLAQVIGVFPLTCKRDDDEEQAIDVGLLRWEDICQNIVTRVDKSWRHVTGEKAQSVLDLVSKKADQSVMRLLQISTQHVDNQLDQLRNEREQWKDIIDKRQHQPLQLALTLKDSTQIPFQNMALAPQHAGGVYKPHQATPLTKRISKSAKGPTAQQAVAEGK